MKIPPFGCGMGWQFWDRCTIHFRIDLSGDQDVHSGYEVLTHGHFIPSSHTSRNARKAQEICKPQPHAVIDGGGMRTGMHLFPETAMVNPPPPPPPESRLRLGDRWSGKTTLSAMFLSCSVTPGKKGNPFWKAIFSGAAT